MVWDKQAFLLVNCSLTWKSTIRNLSISKFALLSDVWVPLTFAILVARRINKSYSGVEIIKFHERLSFYFHPKETLLFLADETNTRFIYKFLQTFEDS